MITIRKSNERGQANFGWLNAKHTFSFGRYIDRNHMGYESLRVINDDTIAPGAGFGEHPHDNMEILTYVMKGAVEHKDSMGNGSVIHPGDIQYMAAGSGVTHSEFNHYKDQETHLLQIWIMPNVENATPRYEQKTLTSLDKENMLALVASNDGRDGSIAMNQDANMYQMALTDGSKTVRHDINGDRRAWVHVAQGKVTVNGHDLEAGDGAAISDEDVLFSKGENADILLFDLAPLQ